MKRLSVFLCAVLIVVSSSTQLLSQNSKRSSKKQVKSECLSKEMPIIGVSAKAEYGGAAANFTYVNAIRRAGGVPLVIPVTSDSLQIAAILNNVDAIVMTGGEDYDPQLYGEQPIRALGEIAPARDEFDLMLIKMAVKKDLPLLGICRGEQGLNIVFGGTLYQDIPSQKDKCYIKHNQDAPGSYGTHSIKIDKGSNLYKILGNVDSIRVNSFHHQAVKDIAPGFKVTAVSEDGIVEAIEMVDNCKVFGVQFHPEIFTAAGYDQFIGIFRYLVEMASK